MTPGKQQFNVYLDPSLVQATKRASLERQQTLSELVSDALRAYLQAGPREPAVSPPGRGVVPMPILFVRDVKASLGLFKLLGLRLRARSRNGRWAELESRSGALALHAADSKEEQRVEMTFESLGPLEPLVAALKAGGHAVGDVVDEGFGRSVAVTDPNGLELRIDEHERELTL